MSKARRAIPFFSLCLAFILAATAPAAAQVFEAVIKIEGGRALVEGRRSGAAETSGAARNFSFLDSYAGAENLGARVTDVVLFGRDGRRVEYKKLAAGEYLAAADFDRWTYAVGLKRPAGLSALAHVSTLAGEQGILMTADLLPQFPRPAPARVTVELPAGWQILTAEKSAGAQAFAVDDVADAVFLVGKNWRAREFAAGDARGKIAFAGAWNFSDDEAVRMTGEIYGAYRQLFGGRPAADPLVALVRFPPEAKAGRWEAETRGRQVTIFSADMPFSTQSAQKLHEQLRHELFHLWLPNDVNLSGSYDWFYEGFALYQSLRTALALNRIRFEDYLDTLGRAYDLDALTTQRPSLLEASLNRWSGAGTQIYARGMLVAFLVDAALLRESKGRRELADVLREIYQKHRFPAAREDGNAAVLRVLTARAELRPLVEKYVRGRETIDWQTDLDALGIEARADNFSTKLTVKAKTNGRQKDLLDKLGYNNWRKRSEN